MKIKTRLILNPAINTGLMVLLIILMMFYSSEITKESEKQQIAHQLVRQTTDLITIGEEYIVYHYPRTIEQWNSNSNSIKVLINNMGASDIISNISTDLNRLDDSFFRLRKIYSKFGGKILPEEWVLLEEELSGQMRIVSRDMIASSLKLSEKVTSRINIIQRKRDAAILVALFLIIAISIMFSYRTLKRITEPLSALVRDANIIKDGNLKHKVTGVESTKNILKDEIGELSLSFSSMTNKLLDSIANLESEISERVRIEELLQKAHDNLEQQVNERTLELSKANEALSSDITKRKQVEEALQKKTYDLGERIKELNCLYGFSELIEKPGISLDEIFQGLVDLIPLSWQYPEVTCSRLVIDDQEFNTKNFKETTWKQTADIIVHDNQQGTLEVYYLEEKPEIDEGPFLNEERNLLDATSDRLGRIIERTDAEKQLQSSLKEKETLLHEIHHRVKNNMNVISSLLKLQSNSIDDKQIKGILNASQSRVYAMSAVHETLHGSENLSEINLKNYLSKITTSIFQSSLHDPKKVKLNNSIEEMFISINQASPLGLIINELISNSLKYAFPDERKGEISVSLKKLDNKRELTVMDNGVGMPKDLDWKNSNTLGLKLVRTLVENQLDGSIDLNNANGTKFTIKFNIES